jgi:Protein of unknown function (DUF992)
VPSFRSVFDAFDDAQVSVRRIAQDSECGLVMAWAVFMPTRGTQYGALAGSYGGVSGDLSLGVGVGGNILVGGSERSVTLQPFSVEGNVGVNLAIGVSGMVLQFQAPVR